VNCPVLPEKLPPSIEKEAAFFWGWVIVFEKEATLGVVKSVLAH